MLGVRRFQGAQLDLFQGELRLFASDVVVDARNLQKDLAAADAAGFRHVAITAARDAMASMNAVKAYLEGERPGLRGIGRLSFVLVSLDQYYEFQDALFRTFPDEP